MSDTTEILQTINTTIKKVMEQQATLMRMYDTVDQKFTRIEKQLEKFKKEWRVRKALTGVTITQDLLSCGQNDMIYAIQNLTGEFNKERRDTEARIAALQSEVQILTQLFIHGDDIKTYDLSTTFPEAYGRIVELEKQRAKTRPWRLRNKVSPEPFSSDEDTDMSMSPQRQSPIPLTDLARKEL
jgi:16S rRNA G1207 methylase RsmC